MSSKLFSIIILPRISNCGRHSKRQKITFCEIKTHHMVDDLDLVLLGIKNTIPLIPKDRRAPVAIQAEDTHHRARGVASVPSMVASFGRWTDAWTACSLAAWSSMRPCGGAAWAVVTWAAPGWIPDSLSATPSVSLTEFESVADGFANW